MASHFALLALLAIMLSVVLADNASLQDFCVAETNSSVRVNGLTCKDPKLVDADDFFLNGLHIAGNTSNVFGSEGTRAFVTQLPGLNSLGIAMVRLDYAPNGVNRPHINPRSSEIFTVLEGTIKVGFITSNPESRLITKVLQKGDVWVFPQGLIHYQRNVGNSNAVAFLGFHSQDPGVINIPDALLGSDPSISIGLLAKAFQVDPSIISILQSEFWTST